MKKYESYIKQCHIHVCKVHVTTIFNQNSQNKWNSLVLISATPGRIHTLQQEDWVNSKLIDEECHDYGIVWNR